MFWAKLVQKTKAHFTFYGLFFPANISAFEIILKKYGAGRQATDDNVTIPRKDAFCLWDN